MQPRYKNGLIVGAVSALLNLVISSFMGLCGPFFALGSGALAGLLTVRQVKAASRRAGVKSGAISAAITGALLLISQILAVIGASYLLMLSGRPAFGANLPPIPGLTSHDRLAIYWVTLLGTGALFGVIDLIAAVLGGTLVGYLSKPAQPAPSDPILLTISDISDPPAQTPRQNHHKVWLIATLSVCGLCLLACVGLIGFSGLGKSALNALAFNNTVGIGKPAPDFTLTTLGGTAVTLTSLKGQPVVLSFGASWCPDCAAEAPILETIHQKYPKLAILAIDSKEPAPLVQGFIKDHSLTFDILMDPNGVVNNRYHIYAIPTLFFIDQEGVVRDIIIEKLTLTQMEQCLGKIGIGI